MSDVKVYAAISKVQGELARLGIGKGQTNTFDKYKFRGIDDVYNALAPLLADAGLVIIPQMKSCHSVDRPTKNGGTMIHTTVSVDYLIAAGDGSTVTASAYGEGLDRSDKSISKASGNAWKYLMFQLFCIPVEGTPDSDSDSPEAAPAVISAQEVAQLRAGFAALSIDEAKVCGHHRISSIEKATPEMFVSISETIKQRSEEQANA